MAHPPTLAWIRTTCGAQLGPGLRGPGSPAPAASRGKEAALLRRRHRIVPSTAGLRGVTAAFTHNVRKHVLLCVAVVVMCPVRSVLPAWLPCQNVLPADLHAIPFARNTQQVLVFAAPVANACCPLLYSCRSITFATVAKPISLSFDGSRVAGARLALAVRFPYIRCTPPRSPRSRPAT